MFRTITVFIIAVHGLIHLMGFIKAFNLAEINQLSQNISRPVGMLWLFCALLFLPAGVSLVLAKAWWWMIAAPALMLSQLLIMQNWQDAKFGSIANLIVLLAAIIGYGAWNFQSMVKSELKNFVASGKATSTPVTAEMLNSLPPLVQKWLYHSRIVGKENIGAAYLTQKAEMRTAVDGKWMAVQAEQWFRTEQPGFIWLADVRVAPGIHMAGRDKYVDGKGHMLIKLLSLFKVADSKGREIDQGSMLRYLAETIWFPSAALREYIQWQQVDSTTARATMTYGGITAAGDFKFNSQGDVISFTAKRFYDRKGGATLEDWLIQMDPAGYREFSGVRIPAKSTVTWKLQEGDLTWLRLEILDIRYAADPARLVKD